MFTRILTYVVAGTLVCGTLPAFAATRTIQATVDKLNVRTGPSLTSPITTTLAIGSTYPVVKESGQWLQIQLSANQTGWVAGWLVKDAASPAKAPGSAPSSKPSVPPTNTPVQSNQTIKLIAPLHVYPAPDQAQSPIGELSAGDEIVIKSTSKGWLQITYDGAVAWIYPNGTGSVGQAPTPPVQPPAKGNLLGTVSVNAPVVNLRSQPTTTSDLVTTMAQGTVLSLIGTQGDWFQVLTPTGQSGWVAGWLVTKPDRTLPQTGTGTVTVLYPSTNIRSGPSTSDAILGQVQNGQKLQIVSKQGEWYQVQLSNGQTGYIAGWLVSSGDTDSTVKPVVRGDELVGKVIVVDPGHGGNDNGATGSNYNTLEKTINLEVAMMLRKKLEASGATVIMTRSDDRKLTLQERVDVAVNNQADLFVSIHHNTHPNTQTNGTIVFYYSEGNSSKLASLVQNEIVHATQYANLQSRYGNYYVLRENPITSILAEVGFLTNPSEELKLRSPQQQEAAAEGLYTGIMQYFASIR
ncbi:MAG: N-acetylmuramoyl-L-alanine amidase [Clostridia bacterium]